MINRLNIPPEATQAVGNYLVEQKINEIIEVLDELNSLDAEPKVLKAEDKL